MRLKWPKTPEELEERLRTDRLDSALFGAVKRALKHRGNWRNRPRGVPNPENFGERVVESFEEEW